MCCSNSRQSNGTDHTHTNPAWTHNTKTKHLDTLVGTSVSASNKKSMLYTPPLPPRRGSHFSSPCASRMFSVLPLSVLLITILMNCPCFVSASALSHSEHNNNNNFTPIEHLNQSSSLPTRPAPAFDVLERSKRETYSRIDEDGSIVNIELDKKQRKNPNRSTTADGNKKKHCRRAIKICGKLFLRASKLLDYSFNNTSTDFMKQQCILREAFFDCIKKQNDRNCQNAPKPTSSMLSNQNLSGFQKRLAQRLWDDRFCISYTNTASPSL